MTERSPQPGDAPTDAPGAAETVIQDTTAHEEHEDRIEALVISEAPPEEVARHVEELDAPDAADTLERLDTEESIEVIDRMQDQAAAEALAHMQLPIALTLFTDFSIDEAARYLALMEPDDAADLLQELPQERTDALLHRLPRELGKLIDYDPETAGGLMTTEFVSVPETRTVAQAIELIRKRRDEMVKDFVYCTGIGGKLTGVIALRTLLLADPGEKVADIMQREITVLRPDVDQEEVGRIFDRYDYFTLPVVDADDRLLGVVTIDDIVDIIRAEHTEDAYKQVGAGVGEAVYSPLRKKIRSRLPWLLLNLVTAAVAAVVVFQFEDLIGRIAILAVLMPMIANQAGNAGQQSLAVTLRGLVLGEVSKERVAPLLVRETLLGLTTGFVTGAAMAMVIYVSTSAGVLEMNPRVGLVAMGAMTGALAVGCLIGAGIPLLMDRLGLDPATASSIFLTMLTDTAAFAAFLGLAFLFQSWLMPTGAG
ncbi:MAG: magnesium transporter [Phycisphaeraceae bacterium]|nr:magnesium transporter [Phycisphaeraceae bacterium]